jgi:hypothetical protein
MTRITNTGAMQLVKVQSVFGKFNTSYFNFESVEFLCTKSHPYLLLAPETLTVSLCNGNKHKILFPELLIDYRNNSKVPTKYHDFPLSFL